MMSFLVFVFKNSFFFELISFHISGGAAKQSLKRDLLHPTEIKSEYLNEIGVAPDALDAVNGGLSRRPERQPDVGVVGEQDPGVLGGFHGGHMSRPAWLRNQADRSVMEDLSPLDQAHVELRFSQQHVGARVPVEHEFPLPVLLERHESQRRPCMGVEANPLTVHSVLLQYLRQHMPKLVVSHLQHKNQSLISMKLKLKLKKEKEKKKKSPNLADKGGVTAEPGDGAGDIGRSAAGGFEESGGLSQGNAGNVRDEVDQHFPKGHNQITLRRHPHHRKSLFCVYSSPLSSLSVFFKFSKVCLSVSL